MTRERALQILEAEIGACRNNGASYVASRLQSVADAIKGAFDETDPPPGRIRVRVAVAVGSCDSRAACAINDDEKGCLTAMAEEIVDSDESLVALFVMEGDGPKIPIIEGRVVPHA
jgi:hypothetical protein